MPIITEIIKQKRNKNRYNIYLDGEYAGALNIDELVLNDIKVDKSIENVTFDDIVKRDNQKYAFNLAIKFISLKQRTLFETKQHLLKKELNDDIANNAIDKVLEYGYLDDVAYAKAFVEYQINSGKFGKIVVKHKLKTKGISEQITLNALQAYTEEIETENAQKIYSKAVKRYEDKTALEQRSKMYRLLASKGFSYDIITHLLKDEDNA